MTTLIGRQVYSLHYGKSKPGIVVEYEPQSAAMCDARVEYHGGVLMWHASSDLRLLDGSPLPDRKEVCRELDIVALADLKAARQKLIDEWNKPWPGCEHGKYFVGTAYNEAISRIKQRLAKS